jgi:two-component system chemotaxis response regulator CheY
MSDILIVDFSSYKDRVAAILRKKGYGVDLCSSAYDAMGKLKVNDYDLIISEVELPGDNAFDLYYYINKNYPYIPMIMTTEKSIDGFFDRIFEQGIGNVLGKPLKKSELLNLAEKLITKKNIFGLENYLKHIDIQKKIRITASAQIQKAASMIIDELLSWGIEIKNRTLLNLVLNEMAINAVYHSHGLTREKEARQPVTLDADDCVDIFFARSSDKYAISIVDYRGVLTKQKILESINRVIEQTNLIERAYETGEDISDLISETGRGFDLVRKLTGEYYFVIQEKERTEVVIIFNIAPEQPDERASSLKIIEVYR